MGGLPDWPRAGCVSWVASPDRPRTERTFWVGSAQLAELLHVAAFDRPAATNLPNWTRETSGLLLPARLGGPEPGNRQHLGHEGAPRTNVPA